MSKASSSADLPVRRIDRILAFMALGITLLAIVCFFVIMIASASGVPFDTPLWLAVSAIVYIAPIIAFLMIIALLVMNFTRRNRANRGV